MHNRYDNWTTSSLYIYNHHHRLLVLHSSSFPIFAICSLLIVLDIEHFIVFWALDNCYSREPQACSLAAIYTIHRDNQCMRQHRLTRWIVQVAMVRSIVINAPTDITLCSCPIQSNNTWIFPSQLMTDKSLQYLCTVSLFYSDFVRRHVTQRITSRGACD